MHEMSLAVALLRQVEALRQQQGAERVTGICVHVGEFSGVEPDLLREACRQAVEGTSMQGARLELETVPLEAGCEQCGTEFRIHRFTFECPRCRNRNVTVLRGEELVLDSVTMETKPKVESQ